MPVSNVSANGMLPLTRPATATDLLPIGDRQLMAIDGSDSVDLAREKARLREAANDFEAIFVRQLLSSMRSTLSEGGMFGDGAAGEIYSGFMEEAIAEKVTERGGLGLSDMLYNRMVRVLDPSETEVSGQAAVFAKGFDEF